MTPLAEVPGRTCGQPQGRAHPPCQAPMLPHRSRHVLVEPALPSRGLPEAAA